MAKKYNRSKGGMGESIALSYLLKHGHQLVEANYSTKYGEIDLITTDNGILVFVEVKLKVGELYGTPEEMINKRKVSQIQRTAEFYLHVNKEIAANYKQQRIDAVAIVLNESGEVDRINHYENVNYD